MPDARTLHATDRPTAALALLVTAGTHVPLVREHLAEAPYIGVLFLALILAAVGLAVALLVADTPAVWAAAGSVCLAAVVAFVLSRTVGLPQVGDDVGNWTEALSYPALTAEAIVVAVSALTLRAARRGTTLSRSYAAAAPSSRTP